jgi:hypothetical protein
VTPVNHSDGTCTVQIPGGQVRLLQADFHILAESKYPFRVGTDGKVARSEYENGWKTSQKVFLHAIIAGAKEKQRVKALDGDYTNCTRSNLKLAAKHRVDDYKNAPVEPDLEAWFVEAQSDLKTIGWAVIGKQYAGEEALSDCVLEVWVALKRYAAGEGNLDGFGTDKYRKARFMKWMRETFRTIAEKKAQQLGDVSAEGNWTKDAHLNLEWMNGGNFQRTEKGKLYWQPACRMPAKGSKKGKDGNGPDGMADHGMMGCRASAMNASAYRHMAAIEAEERATIAGREDVDPKHSGYAFDLLRKDGQLYDNPENDLVLVNDGEVQQPVPDAVDPDSEYVEQEVFSVDDVVIEAPDDDE